MAHYMVASTLAMLHAMGYEATGGSFRGDVYFTFNAETLRTLLEESSDKFCDFLQSEIGTSIRASWGFDRCWPIDEWITLTFNASLLNRFDAMLREEFRDA